MSVPRIVTLDTVLLSETDKVRLAMLKVKVRLLKNGIGVHGFRTFWPAYIEMYPSDDTIAGRSRLRNAWNGLTKDLDILEKLERLAAKADEVNAIPSTHE